jgi:hypothetical protein
MSLVFSDPTTEKGIVQLIDDNCGTNSVSYPLTKKARDANLALDSFFALALQASGKWQIDDKNHLKDPIIYADLVSGQADYHFTTDEQGIMILDIYRVMVADEQGVYHDLDTVDQQDKNDTEALPIVDGRATPGKPDRYDKTGNGIFLAPIPDYNYPKGLKVFINREGSYFVSTDTIKVPGIIGLFHEYLVIRPSYFYAIKKNLPNAKALQTELLLMERKIEEHFGKRAKDERPRFKGRITSFR